MASSPKGEIFAAYVDVTSETIDVWRAADHNSSFERITTTPFPNLAVVSHPRLRVSPDGALYVAAQILSGGDIGIVYINRYFNGAWGKAIPASNSSVVYPCVDFDADACKSGNGLRVRTGPQFSFDIGAQSISSEGATRDDAIRMLYTRRDSDTNRLYIAASMCALSLDSCSDAPGWGIGPGKAADKPLDAFNPNVAAWKGFIGVPPAWTSTFHYRYGLPSSKIYLARANLVYLPNGARIYFPVDLVKAATICPDLRGYLGDYDDLVHAGFSGATAIFVSTMTDSSAGCSKQWTFTAQQQHVRAFRF